MNSGFISFLLFILYFLSVCGAIWRQFVRYLSPDTWFFKKLKLIISCKSRHVNQQPWFLTVFGAWFQKISKSRAAKSRVVYRWHTSAAFSRQYHGSFFRHYIFPPKHTQKKLYFFEKTAQKLLTFFDSCFIINMYKSGKGFRQSIWLIKNPI